MIKDEKFVRSITVDCDGSPLEIGDIVYYRKDYPHSEFKFVGIVDSKQYGEYITIQTNSNTPEYYNIEKYPKNLRKMSDEKAMLWKLENL
jgi:hypothetical protein